MNLSTAIMLVNKGVRAVRVEYDPDTFKNNNPNVKFKTLDPDLKVDDYVIVPTATRHGFTVGKVKELGFRVDFSSAEQFGWIVGKVDKVGYDNVIAQEKIVVDRIGQAEENRMREELSKSMGLGEIDFTDLDVTRATAAPQLSTPRGGHYAEAPKDTAQVRTPPPKRFDVDEDPNSQF